MDDFELHRLKVEFLDQESKDLLSNLDIIQILVTFEEKHISH